MIVYGKQIFLYLLESHSSLIEEVYFSKEIDKKIFAKVSKLGVPILRVDNKKAQAMAKGGNHQGFILKIRDFKLSNFDDIKKNSKFLVVLVGLTDVGNIGSIVRTAYSLGVDAMIVSEVSNINLEAVVRSSSGSMLDFNLVMKKNTLDVINELKQSGFTCVGAGFDGVDERDFVIPEKRVLFLGSEGLGIPKKIMNKLDNIVKIEMNRDFDSLNVSAAGAILINRMKS
jgi:23S rRNA (guanosine2251-2'-O)-methyltransferase